jgi:hypothetical protein
MPKIHFLVSTRIEVGFSQLCRATQGEFPTQIKSEFGSRMAPGRLFEVFSFRTAGVGPEPVRGPFVADIDQNQELVGGN